MASIRMGPRTGRHGAESTQEQLRRRWSAALDGIDVWPGDTFYDLGGSSLQVAEFIDRLRYDWAVPLTPRDMVEHPTLAEFADHIDALRTERFRRAASTTVCLQEGSPHSAGVAAAPEDHTPTDRTPTGPLFCLAGAGASSLSFLRLAGALDPEVTVYSLHGKGLESRGLAEWTIRGLVRRQLREIRRIQPSGRYHLTGHSSGAVVALECARALRASGAPVAPLVLIDPQVPPKSLPTAPPVTPHPPATDSAASPRRQVPSERLAQHVRVTLAGLRQFDVTTQQDVLWERGRRAYNRHRLAPFDHPVTIALSREYRDQRPLWPAITGQHTRILDIGERHNDALRDNGVAMRCADLITDYTFGESALDPHAL